MEIILKKRPDGNNFKKKTKMEVIFKKKDQMEIIFKKRPDGNNFKKKIR